MKIIGHEGSARISKDDARIWLEVQAHLRDVLKRPVKPDDFVDFAEGAKGPNVERVRHLLCFDRKTEAQLVREFRVERAREITRYAFVLVKGPKEEPIRVRGVVSVKQVPNDPTSGRGYISIAEVARSRTRQEEVLDDARRDLLSFQQKYKTLAVLFGPPGGRVLDVVASAIKQVDALRKAPTKRDSKHPRATV